MASYFKSQISDLARDDISDIKMSKNSEDKIKIKDKEKIKYDVSDDGLRPSCRPKGGRGAEGPPIAVILTIQRGLYLHLYLYLYLYPLL